MWYRWLVVWFLLGSLEFGKAQAQPFFQHTLTATRPITLQALDPHPDGSVVYCGHIYNENFMDGFLLKIDTLTKVQWSGLVSVPDFHMNFTSLNSTSGGTILGVGNIANNTTYYPFLMHCSEVGDEVYGKYYDFGYKGYIADVRQLKDKSLLMVGLFDSVGAHDVPHDFCYILKTDTLGNPLWCNRLTHPEATISFSYSLFENADSTIFVLGYIENASQQFGSAPRKASLVQLYADGRLKRHVVFRIPNQSIIPYQVLERPDKSYLIGGETDDSNGVVASMLLSLDSSLRLRWASSYSAFFSGRMQSLCEAADGTALILFAEDQDRGKNMVLLGVDDNGQLQLVRELERNIGGWAYCIDHRAIGKGYLVTSADNFAFQMPDHFVVSAITSTLEGCGVQSSLGLRSPLSVEDTSLRLVYEPVAVTALSVPVSLLPMPFESSTNCSADSNSVSDDIRENIGKIFPNPALKGASIVITIPMAVRGDITLRDATGREVYRTHRDAATAGEQIQIPTAGLASGVYTVELLDASSFTNVWRGKVVVE